VVKNLRSYCERAAEPEERARRGDAHQRVERFQEQTARRHAIDVGERLVGHGWSRIETANLLDLTPRTLRQWRRDLALGNPALRPLGRPVFRSSRERRNDVIHLLDELGPVVGVPALRASFPDMLRAELEDLLTRYRRVWRKRNKEPLRVLHWHQPGRVWAIDFTGPGTLVEGRYPYLLAVRDLASGQQLLWLPVKEATAQEVANALTSLFMIHGVPLVLKCDNGSPFIAALVDQVVHDFGVEILFSPPGRPRYNGAIEAGIGSMKTRTEEHACRHDRPGQWTFDDVEAARLEANTTARLWGPPRPTLDEAWSARTPTSAEERTLFQAEVERQRQAVDAQGGPEANPQTDLSERARNRLTIRRALEGLGYLKYTRRRINLPIRKKKVANIR
jgi:transposase InsO family protein